MVKDVKTLDLGQFGIVHDVETAGNGCEGVISWNLGKDGAAADLQGPTGRFEIVEASSHRREAIVIPEVDCVGAMKKICERNIRVQTLTFHIDS